MTIFTSIGSRALGLAGTLCLVRFLAPAEYGEVSVAAVVVMTANQLSTLGVGMYIIANPRAGRAVTFHATAIHVGLGLAAFLVVGALGGRLGPWLDAPSMSRFLPGLGVAMLFDRITFMPERVLARDLRFGRRAAARSVGELAYTAVSVGAAMAGFGAFAVVLGNLARSSLRMVLMVSAVAWREWLEPSAIDRPTLRALSSYGLVLFVSGMATFATRYWDNALVSHLFGPAVMGAYQLAYNLADVPAVQVGEQVTDVLLSSFVHMDHAGRLRALERSLALLGLLIFPLAIGLGAIAPTVARVGFPHRWAGVGAMLLLLSALSVPRPISGALGAYLQARDQPRSLMVLDCAQLALLLGSIATVGSIGPLWTCGVVGVVFTARAFANLWLVRALDGAPIRTLLRRMAPPLLACAPLVLAVVAARSVAARLGLAERPIALVAEVVAGAAGYLVGAITLARSAVSDLLTLVRRALAPRDLVSAPSVSA